MALNSGKILMRRGQEVNFDPSKMTPGEWAVSLDSKYVRMCFSPGVCVRMATYDAFEVDMEQIRGILAECQTVEEAVQRIYEDVKDVAVDVERIEAAAASALESEENALNSANSAIQSANTAIQKAEEASESANIASTKAEQATEGASTATQKASEAAESAGNVRNMSEVSQSYAVGGTGTREGEDVDNAKYYNQQASDNADRAEAAAERASALADVGVATTEKAGLVKPDGETIRVDPDGTIHADRGTTSYTDLENKPRINDVELNGNKTIDELGGLTEESTVSFTETEERTNIEATDNVKGIFGKVKKWFSDLKTVAFTGKYEDLKELPTIPSKTSELENDSKYISTANILDSYMEIESNTEFNQFAGALGVKEGIVNVEQRITDVATVTEVKDGLPNYSGESLLPSIDCCFINYFDGYYVTGYIKKSLGRVELTLFMSKDAQLWDSIKRFILNGENYAPAITCSIVNKNTMLIGAYAEKDSIPGKIINITSNNGEWEVKVSSINDKITSLAYGKGMYIAVSNNQARIYSSTDGTLFNCVKSISSVTSGWNYVFTSVIYSEYGFVAVGYREILENGVLGITQMYATSIDGNTWSDNIYRESGDYRGTVFNSVAYNDGNFFVVGDDLSYVLIASAEDVFSNVHDEDTWLSGWNMPLYYGDVNSKILCINNVFITLGYSELKPGGVVCVSPNGISDWEYMSGIPEDISNIKDIVYHEGEIIIIDNMGKEFLLSFEKIRSNINDYTKEHLINEKNESFYFGFNGKDRGFFTGRNRSSENFYPFLQNASQIMQRGEIKITSTSDDATFVPMERNCVYMMPVVDITISNGAIRGYRTYIIYTSEDPSTGVGVILKSTLASGGTSQLSITDIKEVERVGVNIKPNNVAYKTMYTLIKLM